MAPARLFTSDAEVAGLEVWHQLLGAGMNAVQRGVWNHHATGAPTGTLAVQVSQHVRRAADTAVILAHAPPEPAARAWKRSSHYRLTSA